MKLYAFRLPDETPLEDYETLLLQLKPEERNRVQRFRLPDDRLRSLVARLALRYYLRVTGQQEVAIKIGKKGKPYTDGLGFNVSHEGKWVLLGVDKDDVGVDIMEPPRDPEEIKEALLDQMTTSERLALAVPLTTHQLRTTLTTLWTLKEGYTKAIGEGVGFGLERINVVLDELKAVRVEVDGKDIDWQWRIGDVQGMAYAAYWKISDFEGVEIVTWSQLVSVFD